jgi:beta-aspartyl-peptidase (threonine type)
VFSWLVGVPDSFVRSASTGIAESSQIPESTGDSGRLADGLGDRLHGILAIQQNAWNQGDIRQFMDAYWNEEALTFSSGGKTTRGWQATYERYKSKYPDRTAMGQLTFDALETSQIDEQAALTLGNWKLDKDKPARGNFSLVWKRIDGQWKIVHDHSSLLAEPN